MLNLDFQKILRHVTPDIDLGSSFCSCHALFFPSYFPFALSSVWERRILQISWREGGREIGAVECECECVCVCVCVWYACLHSSFWLFSLSWISILFPSMTDHIHAAESVYKGVKSSPSLFISFPLCFSLSLSFFFFLFLFFAPVFTSLSPTGPHSHSQSAWLSIDFLAHPSSLPSLLQRLRSTRRRGGANTFVISGFSVTCPQNIVFPFSFWRFVEISTIFTFLFVQE